MSVAIRWILRWFLPSALLIALCWFGVATYYHTRRAKMHSQVAVLAANLEQHLAEEKGEISLKEFLSTYEGGTLFERDEAGDLTDAWGSPLIVEIGDAGTVWEVAVISTGRDRVAGTDDDFVRGFQAPKRHRQQTRPNKSE